MLGVGDMGVKIPRGKKVVTLSAINVERKSVAVNRVVTAWISVIISMHYLARIGHHVVYHVY